MTDHRIDTIVCLPITEWAGLPHNSRHLMAEAARRGYRVLWVDPLGLRSATLKRSDIAKLSRRLRQLRRPLAPVTEGIWRLAAAGLPIQDTRIGAALNERLLAVQIRLALRKLKAKRPLLWAYSPQQVRLRTKIDCEFAIYYRTDAYPASPGINSRYVESLELEAASLADLCIAANSRSLSDLPDTAHRRLLVPNGIDLAVFDASVPFEDPIPEVEHPRLLVIGTFDNWMDIDLLRNVMLEHPDWSLVLAGDCKTQIDSLTDLPRVSYLGHVPFSQLPALVGSCDIGLVPFRIDPFTTRGSPGKIYQYLSMGLPVLCTPFLDGSVYSGQIDVAPGEPVAFAEAITELLRSNSKEQVGARRAFAAEQAWERRFESIEDEIARLQTGG